MTNFNTATIYNRILTLENVGTAVNYCSIFITFAQCDKLKYCGNLQQNFNPRKCRYSGKLLQYFITFAHGEKLKYYSNVTVIYCRILTSKCRYSGKLLQYFYNICPWWQTKILWPFTAEFTPENVGSAVNNHGIFITLA